MSLIRKIINRRENKAARNIEAEMDVRPKTGKAAKIIIFVIIASIVALVIVIRLNQIFHWWLTPPF